jgi:hypothetical protein
MTDRDAFAAAALTGLVAGRYDATATVASRAYNLADAMLRERERTNHDAVPEARAEYELKEPNGSSTGEPGGEPESTVRTGNTPQPRNGSLSGCETVQQEPVAFAVVCKEMTGIDVYDDAYDAAEYATVLNRKGWTANVVRLVPQASPTLTDAERGAIEWCLEMATIHATDCDDELASLRSLLERLK